MESLQGSCQSIVSRNMDCYKEETGTSIDKKEEI
jgi:hypothetical protein